jgi:hypothetical protein
MRYYFPIICFFQILLVSTFSFGQESIEEQATHNDSLPLRIEELLMISELWINDEENDEVIIIDGESQIGVSDYFSLSEISWSDFEIGQKNATNFLIRDTSKIKKKNGVIQLICKNGVKKYIDHIPNSNDYDENIQTYEYVGSIPILNTYVILGIYWEEFEYILIDKTTGEEIASFNEIPYISPDKTHIISITSSPYGMNSELSYYSITDMKIKPIVTMQFTNWMAADYSSYLYWGNDGSFYVGVNSIANFWDKNGETNLPKQFIKFTRNN